MILQKAPLGLSGALDLKVLGFNPDKLEDALRGVLELRDLYTADLIAQASNTSAGEVTANSILLAVDQGHLWLVRNVSARITFATASNLTSQQLRFTLQYIPDASGRQFYLDTLVVEKSTLVMPVAAGDSISFYLSRTFETPFLMKPGWKFQLSSSTALSAGSYDLDLRADVIALQI